MRSCQASAQEAVRLRVQCLDLEVIGSQSCPFRDACEHLGADFFAIMEREDKVRPALALECLV
jgi:hypothetical protein